MLQSIPPRASRQAPATGKFAAARTISADDIGIAETSDGINAVRLAPRP
jgi:hypothetical protein